MSEKQNKLGKSFWEYLHYQTLQAESQKSAKRIIKLRSFIITKWYSFIVLKIAKTELFLHVFSRF